MIPSFKNSQLVPRNSHHQRISIFDSARAASNWSRKSLSHITNCCDATDTETGVLICVTFYAYEWLAFKNVLRLLIVRW